MKKYHPDVCVLAYTDTLTLAVESINSSIFDARMISVISSFGGKLVDYDSDK